MKDLEIITINNKIYKFNLTLKNILLLIKDRRNVDNLMDSIFSEGSFNNVGYNEKVKILGRVVKFLFPNQVEVGKVKSLDLFIDFDLIYSTFIKEYGIDLLEDDINWFKFSYLLKGALLSGKNAISKVVDIRIKPIPKTTKYNGEQIRAIKKAKSQFSLTKETSPNQVNAELGKIFMYFKSRAKK